MSLHIKKKNGLSFLSKQMHETNASVKGESFKWNKRLRQGSRILGHIKSAAINVETM